MVVRKYKVSEPIEARSEIDKKNRLFEPGEIFFGYYLYPKDGDNEKIRIFAEEEWVLPKEAAKELGELDKNSTEYRIYLSTQARKQSPVKFLKESNAYYLYGIIIGAMAGAGFGYLIKGRYVFCTIAGMLTGGYIGSKVFESKTRTKMILK